MIRVSIDISPYIGIEVSKQSLNRGEDVGLLQAAIMPMIPFSRLIVVSENTHASVDQRQPVFHWMPTAWEYPR
jgi:hypothetical protein